MPEFFPQTRAVQLCRLVALLRNSLQCSEVDQHRPAHVFPDAHQPDCRVARPFPQQPRHIVVHDVEHIHQQVVDQAAVGVIEHILEHQTDDDPRGDDRQIKADAEDRLSPPEVVDQVGKQHSAQQNERHCHQRVQEIVPVSVPEAGAAGQNVLEVFQADERDLALHDPVLRQRDPNGKKHRIDDERQHQQQAGKDEGCCRRIGPKALFDG